MPFLRIYNEDTLPGLDSSIPRISVRLDPVSVENQRPSSQRPARTRVRLHRGFSEIASPPNMRARTASAARMSHSFALKFLNGKANGLNPDHADFPTRL